MGVAGASGGAGGGGGRAGGGGTGGGASAGRGGGGGTGTGGASGGGGTGGGASAGRGGAGGTGGTSGGAGGGTIVLGGESLCAAGAFLLCEGFEGVDAGDNTPPSWGRRGNATVVDNQAARGAHAIKLTPDATLGYAYYNRPAGVRTLFPSAHWGRLFYRVQTPAPDAAVHASFAVYNANDPFPAMYHVVDTMKMAAPASTHQFLYHVTADPSGSEYTRREGPYDRTFDGNWHCAEWFVDGDNQAYQFYFDGTEVTELRIRNGPGNFGSGSDHSWIPKSYINFFVGFFTYENASSGFTAWIDEVAIDANRIGCTR